MEIYHVGGSVRDVLLNVVPKDLDYVVVGSSPEEMEKMKFTSVGNSFPVFLHPNTGDEYALARTEKSTGSGYHDFEVVYDSSISLEDDLYRRDLTLNSLAVHVDNWETFKLTKDKSLVIDPFNGMRDLDNSMLRHVSIFFKDDPVRVLRVCRFAARYGFAISDDTSQLMSNMVQENMLDNLTAERVWLELEKSLSELRPLRFFKELDFHNALKVVLPWIADEPTRIDESGIGAIMASNLQRKPYRFAAWSRFFDMKNLIALNEDLKVPAEFAQGAVLVNDFFRQIENGADPFDLEWIVKFLTSHNCIRDDKRIWPLTKVLDADGVFQSFEKHNSHLLSEWVFHVTRVCSNVKFDQIPEAEREGLVGKAIGEKLHEVKLRELQIFMDVVFAQRISELGS